MNGRISLLLGVFLACFCSNLFAGPVGKNGARNAAVKWLRQNRKPMGRSISGKIKSGKSLKDAGGAELCYVFNLDQGGFVVMSSDDRLEPVIAFSENGTFDFSSDNPFVSILKKDMAGRLKLAGKDAARSSGKSKKWKKLDSVGLSESSPQAMSSSIGDVRVEPFLSTKWNQGDAAGGLCYNYYTPNNYLTGCVATAMAQLMRYHQWPQSGIGVHSYSIKVDGVSRSESTMGGDGSGGAYNWSQMPEVPSSGLTTTQRQAIGRLMHDAGTSVGMAYTSTGSSASTYNSDKRFTDLFDYSNSIYTSSFPDSGNSTVWTILNSNLNARLPVILSISRVGGGHAVVTDGYGFSGSTQYHHISLGWGGYNDAWYNLPTIDTSNYTYTMLDACIYNVYPTGSGEILSGQVTSLSGIPVDGATVKAYYNSSLVAQTVTDAYGIYAFAKLTSDRNYYITVSKDGYAFTSRYVSVGTSSDQSSSCGNKWDADFVSTNASPPTAIDSTVVVDANDVTNIQLLAADDGLPAGSQMSYTVVSLPQYGIISDPCNGAVIDTVPYTLTENSNRVRYEPCPYFGGEDTIQFYADDGGTAPTGGASNTATLTVDVDNSVYSEIEADSNSYLWALFLKTTTYRDAKMQLIYLASEVGQARNITDVSIRIYPATGGTLENFTIRMQHTDWSSYYSSFPNSQTLATGWTTVYQGQMPVTSDGWINLKFDRPFEYDGTRNLLVDMTYINPGNTAQDGGYYIYSASSSRSLTLASYDTFGEDPLDWDYCYNKACSTSTYMPSIKINGTAVGQKVAGDVDDDCNVCLTDVAAIAKAWGTQDGDADYDYRCDIASPENGQIDLADLAVVMGNWLESYWD